MTTSAPSTTPTSYFPDRDQLSVVTAVILLAYALSRFIRLPTYLIEFEMLAIAFDFIVSGQVILLLLVAALIGTGADALMRSHPNAPTKSRLGPLAMVVHWIVPGTTALSLGLILNTPQISPFWWLALLLSAAFLLAVLIAEYVAVSKRDRFFTLAALGLSALTFLIALVLFAWLKLSGPRASLAAGSTAFIAMLFSLRLLQLRAPLSPRMFFNSAVVGLVVGEFMWAINYWPVTPVGAGLLLVVVFYTCHGLALQNLTQNANRRVVLEYLGIGAFGLILAGVYALFG